MAKSVPRIQDPVTCDSRVILPPGKSRARGSEEIYEQDWIDYIAEETGSECSELEPQQRIAIREGTRQYLWGRKDIAKIANRPDQLSRVTKTYAKRRVTEITGKCKKPQETTQKIQVKKPRFFKTLAAAVLLTAIGIGVGAGCNELRERYKRGCFDAQKESITKYLAEVTK